MQIISLLFAILLTVFQAQGAAVPAKTLRDGSDHSAAPDVNVKFMLANGTIVDAMPGVKTPLSTFDHTSTTQTICVRSDYTGPMTSSFARIDDCKQLVNFLSVQYLGYWDTWDYDSIAFAIVTGGTCAVYISGVQTFGGHVWIGNQDVADAITTAIDLYGQDGYVAAAGQFVCNQPSGQESQIDWTVRMSLGG